MLVRLIAVVVALGALFALYLSAALKWSYSTGERAGWVQKLSRKGWICKTWEGELALVSLPGAMPEKFLFTIPDDDVAIQVTRAMGKRVSLHYEEKVGLPTSCFGDTRYFVTGITVSEEIPLAPGISVPTRPASAPQQTPASGPLPGPSAAPSPAPVQAPPSATTMPAPSALPAPPAADGASPSALPASRAASG